MSTAMPPVPPRPTRSQAQDQATLGSEIPKIPPRPTHRRIERSQSPQRESFARSPLNEFPAPGTQSIQSRSSFSSDPPPRPASVSLPSIGQEGSEYAEVFGDSDLDTSMTQTRNIANDLKLHAPKPSLPTSSAKQRVSTVTRTDSEQAAAFGIGKRTSDDKDPSSRTLNSKASFASQTSTTGTERPPSSQGSEHGIPEIGQRVPMYPNAGDVQAPSPAPFATPYSPGIGFHNDGSKARHHGRKTSGRFEGPPGSYGLHGHGMVHNDRFEKAYYEKHPELYKKETISYQGSEGRAEWAMSSDDLNKIVRDTASRGAGLGTSPAAISTPTEQIGFQASDEYASRMSSPRPQSGYQVAHSNSSQTHMDSPLRKSSFPADVMGKAEFDGSISHGNSAPSDAALESEVEDDDVIHVDEPGRRSSKIYSGAGRLESTEDLGRHSSLGYHEDEILDERGYSAPILAADEVAKEPFGYELQPAVSPLNERTGGFLDDSVYHHRSGSASSLAGSRPSSRPTSIHGSVPHDRDIHSTPLEDLTEYEPLFPEDEKAHSGVQKPMTAADKLKRPELKNRRFPSQDIWEDTPNSLQYTATVSTPQLPEDNEDKPTSKTLHIREGETPEQAFARRQEELAELESTDSGSFLNKEKKPWGHKSHLDAETRPGMKQRFPSRDIWEDTPDSLQLQTTVGGPQSEEKDILSPPDDGPTTETERAATGAELGSEAGSIKPQIPARPTKSKPVDSLPQPVVPGRPQRVRADGGSPPLVSKPKPQVPARPSKITRDSSENVPLAKVNSNSSAKSVGSDQGAAAAAKPKPPVPSRPVGSKIAALQSGFMSDLNKRLQLGPQAPKKEEPAPEQQEEEKEKAPLVDARKGRARGPARRAPAKSPAPTAESVSEKPISLGFSTPAMLWQIHPDEGSVHVASHYESGAYASDAKAPVGQDAEIVPEVTEKTGKPSSLVEEIQHPEIVEKESLPNTEVAEAQSSKLVDESPEDIDGEALSTSTSTLKPSEEKEVE